MTNTDSPSVNSPETPINVASAPNVKIDTDFSEESDARHEPIPLKLEQASKIDQGPSEKRVFSKSQCSDFSLSPSLLCTDVIVPIDPRHETPPRDIEMQEQVQEDGTTPPVLSPFPSAEEDHDQEGTVDAHEGPNGVNGHVVEEKDSKMEDVEDIKDETGPAPLPPTSPTPPAEEGSQGTNADVDESNVHVAPEDQPHPAKRARKHSDADAASVMSVRGFLRVCAVLVFCRFSRADFNHIIFLVDFKESHTAPYSRSRFRLSERCNRASPFCKSNTDPHTTLDLQPAPLFFAVALSAQVLHLDPQEPEKIEGRTTVLAPRRRRIHEYPALPGNHHSPHGFQDDRREARQFRTRERGSEARSTSIPVRGPVHRGRPASFFELRQVQWS